MTSCGFTRFLALFCRPFALLALVITSFALSRPFLARLESLVLILQDRVRTHEFRHGHSVGRQRWQRGCMKSSPCIRSGGGQIRSCPDVGQVRGDERRDSRVRVEERVGELLFIIDETFADLVVHGN